MAIAASSRKTTGGQAAPGWDLHLAYWISQVGSPPITALAAACTLALATRAAWQWAALYTAGVVAFPLLFIVWLVARGSIRDIHIPVRRQRVGPLLVSLGAGLLTWLVMRLYAAPRPFLLLALLSSVQTACVLFITLRWKISMHAVSMAGLASLALLLWGEAATPALLGIPLVAWSRVRLRRHTLAQTVAGALLGASVTLAIMTAG
ncbi:phosphatase PAP2 family protein [Litorilinea aerophila]|uniref:Phosphatase PAP2 family protein n=1 Tax=Litorilinea aerophila TaxID=1204385 RepID=A0A540VC04_9CHLR|nr:phosphatase PAP2 family protein [Litorilinea aerophila]MCC9077866.1 phosphatase PAP2 family protein [Litorilinea aerophila]GIV78219.1 MAG: hypothetical protein KatS3mg050_2613 [Litorilinea sp.]